MTSPTILLDWHDRVATITLNRPEQLNSFTAGMHHELRQALDHVERQHARALILTGAGRGFCAGQDLSELNFTPGQMTDLGTLIDEQFNPLQFEDIDYCYRARHAGYRVVYLPEVEMYHFENVTSGDTAAINYTYVTIKNGMRFKKKWRFMFETEGGPRDEDIEWMEIEKHDLSEIGDLETTE